MPVKPDPEVRADLRCRVCKGPRGALPKGPTQRRKSVLAASLAADPFCSVGCCRKWHRTEIVAFPKRQSNGSDLEWTHAA